MKPIAALALLLPLTGCAAAAPSAGGTPAPASVATGEPSATTAPAGDDELAPGWDQSPDGPSPTPDSALSSADLVRLLRTRSSTTATARSCRPAQVAVSLVGYDVALGHRFTTLTVRNTSATACVVAGVPGIGARGTWGDAFVPEVGRGTGPASPRPVTLAPRQSATSTLEWTGELAGSGAEHVSLLVVQLAAGQAPLGVPATIAGDAASAAPLDIGQTTTLRLTPFARGH